MRSLGLALALYFGVISTGFADYPAKVESKLHSIVEKNLSQELQTVMNEYNSMLNDVEAIIRLAKKAGFSDSEIQAIKSYFDKRPKFDWPKAIIKDQQLILSDASNVIKVGIKELWAHSILINGTSFQWDSRLPATQNLHRYSSLFKNSEDKTSSALDWLEARAWADRAFYLDLPGMAIFLLVKSKAGFEDELVQLNEKVKKLVGTCEAEKNSDANPPLDVVVSKETSDVLRSGLEDTRFKSCSGIRAFARHYGAAVPEDLCRNIDHLADCFAEVVDPDSITDGKREKPSNPNSSKWWNDEEEAHSSHSAR